MESCIPRWYKCKTRIINTFCIKIYLSNADEFEICGVAMFQAGEHILHETLGEVLSEIATGPVAWMKTSTDY